MSYCYNKRVLSKTDDSMPVFSLDRFEGYARITSVYDGDTFKATLILHNRVLKFTFRTLGYDAPEMKPRLNLQNREILKSNAAICRDLFMEYSGFDDRAEHRWWNPFCYANKVNGFVWIVCGKNDKYGRTLVTVYKNKWDKKSINDKMLESEYVNPYQGGTKKEFVIKNKI